MIDRLIRRRISAAQCSQGRLDVAAARFPPLAWIILGLGAMALVVCPLRIPLEETRARPGVGNADAITGNGVFQRDGVIASDRYEGVPAGLQVRGSWVGSEEFQGRHETGWFQAAPKLSVMVSGYPMIAGNRVALEVRRNGGTVSFLPFELHDIGDTWLRWNVALPADADAVRIVATDASTGPGGWLAFSEPFTTHPIAGAQLWGMVQLLTATCLALTLIHAPGLLWFGRSARDISALGFAVLPGPLLLAGLGAACWIGGGVVPPAIIAKVGTTVLLFMIARQAWRRRGGGELSRDVWHVVAVSALITGFAVAKANVSFGPAGELFRDRVSRTLAVGNHSDSQISFHVVQAVAHHLGPDAEQTNLYFAPWRFGSRGPLAGLLATPLVLASGARVPFDHPTHPWRPFDREGFAVYRISCIVLASLAAWVVFATVASQTSSQWGRIALVMAVLAPFFVHEIYFSWPKLIAGAHVLLAFLGLHRNRPFAAGLVLAIGYLYHPLAALSGPFLGLWVLVQNARSGWRGRVAAAALFCAGALTLVIPWQIIGRFHPDDGASQEVFLHYFFFADSVPATWPTWLQSRWDNFAHTFLPGYLLAANPGHESLNSAYGRSDGWVRASFLYWNTLPFALGLPLFFVAAVTIAQGARNAFSTICITLLAPAVFLIVYWGAASTGLMRQCGHTLFLTVIVLAAWSHVRWPTNLSRKAFSVLLHPAGFVWRGFEVALVAFGTTLLNQQPDLGGVFGWNDLLSLGFATVFLVAIVRVLATSVASIGSSAGDVNAR